MPRPKLAIPSTEIVEAYYRYGSARAVARELHISRYVVTRLLRSEGIALRDRHEASRMVQQLAQPPLRTIEEVVEMWGKSTKVIRRKLAPYKPCQWPECSQPAESGGLCPEHFEAVPEYTNQCAWPMCIQNPVTGGLCYFHSGRASGRFS